MGGDIIKKIENKNLNDITYLKDKNDLVEISTKLHYKFGLTYYEINLFIIAVSRLSKNKSNDWKIDFVVRYLEGFYNNVVGTSLGLYLSKKHYK